MVCRVDGLLDSEGLTWLVESYTFGGIACMKLDKSRRGFKIPVLVVEFVAFTGVLYITPDSRG